MPPGNKILEVRAAEAGADTLALWVTVTGEAGGAYTYDMSFRALDDAGPSDVVQHHDDLPIVIDADSVDRPRRRHARLHRVGHGDAEPEQAAVRPPLARPSRGRSVGPRGAGVIQVLEEQINPQIAAHGGRADLVAVEDSIAYLRLSGGCQGCGMASVTLSQGIEVAILDQFPEITEVVDVTDHASGSNPYYEAAKK